MQMSFSGMGSLITQPFDGRMTNSVFVAGGTGKTGGRVVARLQQRGVACRAGARSTGFDWSRPDGWRAALGDSDAVYIAYSPDLAVPSAAGDVAEFGRIAVARGVRRFVLLSGRGEPEAQEAEQALAAVVPDRTVLRASWMNQNFSEGTFHDLVRSGDVALPVGDVGEPFIDCDDIADAAVSALLEPGHEGRVYELTGPRLLTFAEAVREIAVATGRDITFTPVPLDDFADMLASFGTPKEAVDLVRYLFGTLFDGRNASVARGVREILGREPRDFREFAATIATD
jgi:uncharacterized protein YbjT (DUF2867 family)